MIRTTLILILLPLMGLTAAACAYEDSEVISNGEFGELYAYVEGENLVLKKLQPLPVSAPLVFCVERRLEVHSGNGLGDSTRKTERVGWVGDAMAASFLPGTLVKVAPPVLDGTCVRVAVTAQKSGSGSLMVSADGLADRWQLTFK